MSSAEIEDYLKRSKRPKVSRDTSVVSSVSTEMLIPDAEDLDEMKVPSTIRLRKSISQSLNNLKSAKGITKDAFIEASWIVCQESPETMDMIVQKALAIADERRKSGIIARAESALRKAKG